MPTAQEQDDFSKRVQYIMNFCLEMMSHPAKPPGFTDTVERHTDIAVVRFSTPYGPRIVTVDRRIAPLIGELWRMGFHTMASCEDYKDGLAYIQFPGRQWGADFLSNLVTELGHTAIEETASRNNGFNFTVKGERFGGFWCNTITIRFDPTLIEPLAERTKQRNDSQQRPGFSLK